ncbi:MAG: ATP-binding cassette domain-containing protein [Bacteroidetes bacterium]|nr:ATP-binding cassette domain-containing protein [Bacteroidota bacterium]MBS1757969.1 ATP-binding cassette domain-containing protein [Bacteroidota bacterium]
MQKSTILEVNNLTVQFAGKKVLNNLSFTIKEGETLAIVGSSGSGKTTLIKTLASRHTNGSVAFAGAPRIATISQQHVFKNLSNTSNFYYQQRFNSCDSEDALSINDVLATTGCKEDKIIETLQVLGMSHLRFTRLIQLSNGEHKRFQIAKAILQNAEWILFDSPYAGLDASARDLLNTIITSLISKKINIILVTSYGEMPSFVTHIAELEKGNLKEKITLTAFNNNIATNNYQKHLPSIDINTLATVSGFQESENCTVILKMVNTNVRYQQKQILYNINWRVNRGECWSIIGHNGSGKSTLLSLITGDNPQAFANEIYLFGQKKGSGETIWEIKKKIGYVSPELHHYFDASSTCFDVVASGLFDTIGLFKSLNSSQKKLVRQWMDLFHISKFEKNAFRQLSNGEQRLVLLARALIKNPPLLILDEPCQGLDAENATWFISLINNICKNQNKTLIYVTHYEHEIPECVTKTLKLHQGKIAV